MTRPPMPPMAEGWAAHPYAPRSTLATALNCAITEPNVQGAAATLWIQWHKPAKGGY